MRGRAIGQLRSGGVIAALVACAALSLAAPASAAPGHAGQLDRSFGQHGRVLLPPPPPGKESPEGFLEVVRLGGGELLVASGHTLLRLRADGRRDRGFGIGGRVVLTSPPDLLFEPTSVAVDPQGRILLAGTTELASGEIFAGSAGIPGPITHWATVRRYLPDGTADTGFGNGGSVESGFGLPAPTVPPDPSFRVDPEMKASAVMPRDIAVDTRGRLLVVGSRRAGAGICYPSLESYTPYFGVFVARLGSSGSLEASQATLGDTHVGFANAAIPRPDGSLLLNAGLGGGCTRGPERSDGSNLLELGADGSLDSSFGEHPFGGQVTIDQRGRILLGRVRPGASGTGSYPTVERLLPDGALDTSFGRGGTVTLPPISSRIPGTMTVDARGRTLIAVSTRLPRAGTSSVLRLMRLTAEGKLDRGFGRNGFVRSGLPTDGFVFPRQVLRQGRDKVVVVATVGYFDHDENRVGLVRYLNGG